MASKRKQALQALALVLTTYWGTQNPDSAKAEDAGGVGSRSVNQAGNIAAASVQANGTWVVNPAEPGPDLPPVGRSLFDFLVTEPGAAETVYNIPFPFTALRDRLASQLRRDTYNNPSIRQVLIPLGRSLQRTAAAPDFFRYPRLVLAVDGEPASRPGVAGMFLKDRLYLGYLEKTGVLEVISYNEAAGRFEFQIVRNYRAGAKPELVYANRAVCIACHQNATPIFSRPLWGETNANARIAARLGQEQRDFYGVAAKIGIDVPNAIDDATDRANRIPVVQFLWQHGCGSEPISVAARRCRGQALGFALQYRLAGNLQFARADNPDWRAFVETFESGFLQRWPDGLLISDPDIPNRIPLGHGRPASGSGAKRTAATADHEQLHRQLHVPSRLEPLRPRPPLEKWQAAGSAKRFITHLADFFAGIDVERLDRQLFDQAAGDTTARLHYRSRCELAHKPHAADTIRIGLHCGATDSEESPHFKLDGRVYLRDGSVLRGNLDQLTLDDGTSLIDVTVSAGILAQTDKGSRLTLQLSHASLHARNAAGHSIESLRIDWPRREQGNTATAAPTTVSGQALVTLREDFTALTTGIDKLAAQTGDDGDALSPLPLRRTTTLNAVYTRLGMPAVRACCEDGNGLPTATLDNTTAMELMPDVPSARETDRGEASFYRRCGRCHQGKQRFPPGFLHGSRAQVRDTLAQCAERLYIRLHMWTLPIEQRTKTPMPPPHTLVQLGVSAEDWPHSSELAGMQRYVHELLSAQTGQQPELQQLTSRGYENLRSCLQEAGKPDDSPD